MRLTALLTALMLPFLATAATAQDQFSPVITVNDSAITAYDLDQRRRLLVLFRAPGNLDDVARQQLIEERLKQQEMDRAGIRITPENIATEVEAFASRANLSLDQFQQILAQSGVAAATLEQFVQVGVTWRDYIRLRYSDQAQITDADIARALAQQSGSADALEVLLTEIIIPAPPPRAAEANAIATQIAQSRSQAEFEAAARQYSALPSRADGGRLNWLPLSNYPPALQGLISSLAVGEVTPPIPITNGVALFQMRGIREVPQARPTPTTVDYAAMAFADTAAAQSATLRVDTCDDLFGLAKGQPADVLTRETVAPDQVPQGIALELAKLDMDEASVTATGGGNALLVMMCGRAYGDALTDPEALRAQLQSQRLEQFANALLADLRAAAVIRP
ncbi:peptidylprolyl isomerase [Loktanella sp. DJP18]|uniref:peptidylprolyl isomerase n=1 Tax=Loktanella sp. DJP18 TaxID=3409788 RepID=UPI003BB50120